jgi:hypothetical protein
MILTLDFFRQASKLDQGRGYQDLYQTSKYGLCNCFCSRLIVDRQLFVVVMMGRSLSARLSRLASNGGQSQLPRMYDYFLNNICEALFRRPRCSNSWLIFPVIICETVTRFLFLPFTSSLSFALSFVFSSSFAFTFPSSFPSPSLLLLLLLLHHRTIPPLQPNIQLLLTTLLHIPRPRQITPPPAPHLILRRIHVRYINAVIRILTLTIKMRPLA